MAEVLLWTVAAFAVLGLPPLLIVLAVWLHERRAARKRNRPPREDGPRPGWPALLVAAWML
jgi:hypothetical protein